MNRARAVLIVAVAAAFGGISVAVTFPGSRAHVDAKGSLAPESEPHAKPLRPGASAKLPSPALAELPPPVLRIGLSLPLGVKPDANSTAWQVIDAVGKRLAAGSDLDAVPRLRDGTGLVVFAYGFEPALARASSDTAEVLLKLRLTESSSTLDFAKAAPHLRDMRATIAQSVDSVDGTLLANPLSASKSLVVRSETDHVEVPIPLGSRTSVELLHAAGYFVLPTAVVLMPGQRVAVEVEPLRETRISVERVEGDRALSAEIPSAMCFADAWGTPDDELDRADSIQWWAFRKKPQVEREGLVGVLRTPRGSAWHCVLTDGLDSGYVHIDGKGVELRTRIGRRSLRTMPLVDGSRLSGDFVILPGELDPTTAAQLLRFPAYQGRIWIRPSAAGNATTVPESSVYTVIQDGRRFATVRWQGDELVGQWASGSLTVRMPPGWHGDAEVSLQTAAPGSGMVRTGVAVPILTAPVTSESLKLDALPLGLYSAQVKPKATSSSISGIVPFGLSASVPQFTLFVRDEQLAGGGK